MERTTSEDIVHVVPNNDYFEHKHSESCRCQPEMRQGVWLHRLLLWDEDALERLAQIVLDR